MSTKQGMTLYSDFARTVRSAMRNQGLKRLIVCSSGGVEEDDKAPWVYTTLIRRVVMNMYMDMMKMETILEESPDIDWTSVRLTFLRPNSEEKRVVLANNRVLGGGCYKISNEDAGKFIAEEAHEGKWIRKYPVLGYAL